MDAGTTGAAVTVAVDVEGLKALALVHGASQRGRREHEPHVARAQPKLYNVRKKLGAISL